MQVTEVWPENYATLDSDGILGGVGVALSWAENDWVLVSSAARQPEIICVQAPVLDEVELSPASLSFTNVVSSLLVEASCSLYGGLLSIKSGLPFGALVESDKLLIHSLVAVSNAALGARSLFFGNMIFDAESPFILYTPPQPFGQGSVLNSSPAAFKIVLKNHWQCLLNGPTVIY